MNYFLVFYIARFPGGSVSYGNVAMEVKMPFLNRFETINRLKAENEFKTITITSIIRLTKEEFDIWNAG